jgi:hypothetical protein
VEIARYLSGATRDRRGCLQHGDGGGVDDVAAAVDVPVPV